MSVSKVIFLLPFLLFGSWFMISAQQTPKTYISYKTIDAINIDGEANEPAWKSAKWSSDFIDIEGKIKPKYKTRVKMIWDDANLYFFAKMEEPHVWGTLKERDTVIFYNNDFEIFMDPDGDTHNYMEFEINALNTVWDLYLTKPYRNHGQVLDNWDMKGTQTAVSINGTLNEASDIDDGWSVEIAIPWSALKEASKGAVPPVNDFWRINFSRVNWNFDLDNGHYSRKKKEEGSFDSEYNWVWSPQQVINMHEPERWGYVYFASEGNNDFTFEIPKDEYVKWYMYEIYRKLQLLKGGFERISNTSKVIKGKMVNVQFQKHILGTTLYVNSPFSGRRLTINANGKFEVYEQ